MSESKDGSLRNSHESTRLANQSFQTGDGEPVSLMPERKTSLILLLAAFGAVYFIWGSTYLGIKYAIETLPPLSMAGTRFLIAGTLLCLWSRLRGESAGGSFSRSSWPHWRTAIIVGVLLFLFGNGGVTWAERHIASSLAALLVATEPLWIVLLNWFRPGGERPTIQTALGLVVGFVGVWLLITPAGNETSRASIIGVFVVLGAGFAWSIGSLYSVHAPRPRSPVLASGMQMLAGGVLLLAAGLLTGEWAGFDVRSVSLRSILAFAYLIFFGSIIAFTAYSWLLQTVGPARTATYAYVNPMVAVILGWALAGETMTPRTVAAAAIIVASVGLITFHNKQRGGSSNASLALNEPASSCARTRP